MEPKEMCCEVCKSFKEVEMPCKVCVGYSEFEPKESSFTPEEFSGLTWREALPLVGRVVEFSVRPDDKWIKGVLHHLRGRPPHHFIEKHESPVKRCELNRGWLFIRTCPETFQHPTITIGGVRLPRPEATAPPKDTTVWIVKGPRMRCYSWSGDWTYEHSDLQDGRLHLAEPRAQAWADWWQNTVIAAVRESRDEI